MKAGSYYIPHMRKLKGEDAHFICEHEQVVGVADGVGGWAKLGIDAGEYARELMSRAEQAVRASPEGCVDPFQVLATAHALTNALGASTACIMALKGQVFYSSYCMQSNIASTIKLSYWIIFLRTQTSSVGQWHCFLVCSTFIQ